MRAYCISLSVLTVTESTEKLMQSHPIQTGSFLKRREGLPSGTLQDTLNSDF